MIGTIQFNELSAMLLDFVDSKDGFLYLRMAGAETAVGAIWARLAAREYRGKKWGSAVSIPVAGRSYPEYVAAQKGVTYRTLRSRLPSGMVDLALIHPLLTVAEDNERGFYLLSYEAEMPPGFFDRLNKSLSIPLKPEWGAWLWELGQQPQSFLTIETRKVMDPISGQYVDKETLTETTQLPIERLRSLGRVRCYWVKCDGRYRAAWLQIIRQQLKLGIRLEQAGKYYLNDKWVVLPVTGGWALRYEDGIMVQAPSLNHLLTKARESLGVHFIIKEVNNGSLGS
jgi:hypothetical protein